MLSSKPGAIRFLIFGCVALLCIVGTSCGSAALPQVGPPPTPTPLPPSIVLVDKILNDLALANVAFNAPKTLQLDDVAVIQLLLSMQQSVEELQEMITAAGEREGESIKVSNRMQARLSGQSFKIEAITPETQAISGVDSTEWKWEIQPTRPGQQQLHLTLSATLDIEDERIPRTVRTFDQTIDVQVTLSQRLSRFVNSPLQWVLTVIAVPLLGWGLHRWGPWRERDGEGD